MPLTAQEASSAEIAPWRDMYRREMACQIIHDSLHSREGWTRSFLLCSNGERAGYGSLAIGGPWKEKHAVFEFYLGPRFRLLAFNLFATLLASSAVAALEGQSNDPFFMPMIHAFGRDVRSESILFHDHASTSLAPPGAVVRRATGKDSDQMREHELDLGAKWVVAVGDSVAGAGDILYHYNRPYGDIYMKVAAPFRGRGLGSFLVQQLKQLCYDGGSVPGARCNPANLASRQTLQKAGFVPCGHILAGTVAN